MPLSLLALESPAADSAPRLAALPAAFRPALDLAGAVPEFLAWRAPGAATLKTYSSVFRLFTGWAADQPEQPFGELVRQWVHHLLQAGKAAATVELHAAALRQLGNYLVRTGRSAAGVDPDLVVPRPEKQVYQRAPLSKKQAKKLVAITGTEGVAAQRAQAIMALMLRAGLRSCEVVRADVCHLQELNGYPVLWVQGKGRLSADSFVVLNSKAHAALLAYLETRPELAPDEPLVVSLDQRGPGRLTERQVQRIVTAALEAAGLKKERISTHSLRHTAASLAIAAGVSLCAVQAMMRHTDPRTTARYVHLRGRLKRSAESSLDF